MRNSILVAACLAIIVVGVYSPSLNFKFVLDDHRFTSDPRIQNSGYVWDYFANYVWAQFTGGPPSFYRPVFVLWMRINFILSGLSPWGWHLLSIAKHLLVAVLLGLLAWRLVGDRVAVLLAAILFALHPAQTESVSWTTVPDPLMAAGILCATLLYLKYLDGTSTVVLTRRKKSRKVASANNSSTVWLSLSVAAYFAALLAKETAMFFPVVVVAIAMCAGSGENEQRLLDGGGGMQLVRALRQFVPFAAVTLVYFLLRLRALEGKLTAATQHLSLKTLVLSWPATLWFYVKVLFWPVRSYSFADPTLMERFSGRGVFLPLLGVAFAAAVLGFGAFYIWERARRDLDPKQAVRIKMALVIGICFLVLPLLLTLNLNALNPGDFLHGRYTYLPSVGLMLLVATGLRFAGKWRVVLLGIASVLTVGFAILTATQEQQWKDDATVFTIAHQLAPHNAPVAEKLADTHVQAALQMSEEGNCSEAIPIFEQVTREYPQDWYAWAGLGDCFFQINNLTKAEESLHRAAQLSHDSRVIEHWQELRVHMGLSNSEP